jgi:hypothetical protein
LFFVFLCFFMLQFSIFSWAFFKSETKNYLNKFKIWTNSKFEKKSKSRKIPNLRKFVFVQILKKSKFEQNSKSERVPKKFKFKTNS